MLPIDSGSDVSWLFLRCSSRKRAKRPIESGSDASRLSDALSSIRLVIRANGFRQYFEGVFADVQVAQLCQPRERRWERLQLIVVEIEEIRQAIEVGQGIRHSSQPVVSEIEHAKASSGGRSAGEFPTGRYRPRPTFRAPFVPTRIRAHDPAAASISSNGTRRDHPA